LIRPRREETDCVCVAWAVDTLDPAHSMDGGQSQGRKRGRQRLVRAATLGLRRCFDHAGCLTPVAMRSCHWVLHRGGGCLQVFAGGWLRGFTGPLTL